MNASDIDQCPSCRAAMPASANFCPGCGRPRSWLREHVEEESRRTGISSPALLERVRHEIAQATRSQDELRLLRVEVRSIGERVGRLEALAGIAPAAAVETMVEEVPIRVEPMLVPERLAAEPAVAEAGETVPATPAPLAPSTWVEPEREDRLRRLREEVEAALEREVRAETRRPPQWSSIDVEELLSGRVLAWTGGLALLLGAIFFLSLAFSRGWIGPSARVAIGLVAGAAMVAAGAWFFERREKLFGHVLVAVGLGVLDIAFLAGTRLYDLFPIEVALLGTLVSALAAAAIAVRANLQVVAGYGLVSALLAPPLLDADPTGSTIAYMASVLVGTTGIALYRSWRWLPPLAFVISAPQLADWVTSDPALGPALAAIAGFWLLHAVAAGGEEFRVRRHVLRSTSATLLLANAAYLVWVGFVLLDGDLDEWRGTFLVAAALGHWVLAAYFLYTEGDHHPFGLLAAGTGLAAFSMAVPVQFGGPVVPIAWAAEAAALAWVYAQTRNGYSAGASLVLGVGAVLHLIGVEYPFWKVGDELDTTWPFLNAAGGTLAFLLGALAVGAWVVRVRVVRALALSTGLLLMIYALPFEVSNVALIGAWAFIYVGAVALLRLPVVASESKAARARTPIATRLIGHAVAVPAAIAAVLAVIHVLSIELPLGEVTAYDAPDVPFTDRGTLAAAILTVAAIAGGALARHDVLRRWSNVAATAVVAYLVAFELEPAWAVVVWAALAAGLFVLSVRDTRGRGLYLAASLSLIAYAVIAVLDQVARPQQLTGAEPQLEHTPFWSDATLAIGALVAALLAGLWLQRARVYACWLTVGALFLATYLMPFELGDATTVAAWSILALAAGALAIRHTLGLQAYHATAAALLALGTLKTLVHVAPPERLAVDGSSSVDHLLLWSGATLALGSLIVVLALGAWYAHGQRVARWLAVIAGALAVYMLSVGLVDAFQGRVGGATALEELQKQAQAGLSILWAVLGGGAIIVGIARRMTTERLFGLALLALATAKVFVVDLASLDAAYRVLSFIGLGILLLASSWAYQHWMPGGPGRGRRAAGA